MQLGLHIYNDPKVATDLVRDYAMASKRLTGNAESTELFKLQSFLEFKMRGERRSTSKEVLNVPVS